VSLNLNICIVDYGQGNLGSIRNMLLRLGVDSLITQNPIEIAAATHLILPGVGAFDRGIKAIHERGLWDILNQQVIEKHIPILGICLGAQLMTRGSEEGNSPGFGWFAADTRRFRFIPPLENLPIPNIGWRNVWAVNQQTLARGLEVECRFYFVHSYFFVADEESDVALMSSYGTDFVAGMQRDNIYSAQFHPEKSHRFGMEFLRNFINV
jgi:imidazole glycerol-phosphate synthase subunit HisH